MNSLSLAAWTVRIAGLALLALGLLIWTNTARAVVPVHMLIGIVLVAALWTEATLALRAGAPPALPVVAIVWGLVTVAFGLTQAQMTVGGSRLIVEVAHLVVGLVAIGLGESLAGMGRSRATA